MMKTGKYLYLYKEEKYLKKNIQIHKLYKSYIEYSLKLIHIYIYIYIYIYVCVLFKIIKIGVYIYCVYIYCVYIYYHFSYSPF